MNILQNINVYLYFAILTMVIAYFVTICFYLEAIRDDFDGVIHDLDNTMSSVGGYDAMLSNLILASYLQNYLSM